MCLLLLFRDLHIKTIQAVPTLQRAIVAEIWAYLEDIIPVNVANAKQGLPAVESCSFCETLDT